VSTHLHPHGQAATTKHVKRKSDRSPLKQQPEQTVGNTKQFWEEHNKVRCVYIYNI